MMEIRQLKPITVLHVVGGLDSDGGLMYVATALARRSAPHVASLVWKHDDFVPTRDRELFVCKGKARRTDQNIPADVLRAFGEARLLVRWIRGQESAVLHAHTRVGMISSAIASKLTGCPLVLHFHAHGKQRWFYRMLLKWTGATAVFTSPKTCRHFEFDPTQSIIVMPCVPWPERPVRPKGLKRFVTAASFVSWKNLHLIIEAFNQLSAMGLETELVMFGKSNRPFRGKEQDQILSLAKSNPLIKVKDHDPDWVLQLTENDVFVHAADQEPFGIVILEAFSRGCRCVVPSETFLDDLSVPARSEGIWRVNPMGVSRLAQQMLAAMLSIQSSEELWRLRTAEAVNFSLEKAVLKLSTVYQSLL